MRRIAYVFLLAAVTVSAVSCDKTSGRKQYDSPCADLTVRGQICDISDGSAVGSVTVTIAHKTAGATEYSYSEADVVTATSSGVFEKTYTEYYPYYTDLEVTVTDPSGGYVSKKTYYNNLIYTDGYDLYHGTCTADFGIIKLRKNNK